MSRSTRTARPIVAALAAAAVAILGAVVPAAPASASPTVDSAIAPGPLRSEKPAVVGSAPLPTAQMNGVAWTQLVVGNTVYVGGEFTSARPPGAAAGQNESARGNLMAFDIRTGALLPWAPVANAAVRDLAVSPDGSTLYVVGSFTAISGETRYRAAAFSTATGALLPFRPVVNGPAIAVAVSSSAVYVGGSFATVNGVARSRVAALHPTSGATFGFDVPIDDGRVQALAVAPDQASVLIGGSFQSVGGSSRPGYGLARVDAVSGGMLPLPANEFIRNGGANSAILSFASDGTNFYGTGYHFGSGGNVEGTFAGSWADGSLTWVEDCHGDSVDVVPFEDAVYTASHKHYCGNSASFPQTSPWTMYRGTAVTKEPAGLNVPDIYGYGDHDGEPRPDMLDWYPEINTGTFTGQGQGPWSIAAGADHVVMGGEFTRVNNVPQQGLVRFASRRIAADTDGPRLSGAGAGLQVTSPAAGTAVVSWPANRDRGDEELVYALFRDNLSTVVQERRVTASFWKLPTLTFVDAGLTPGATHRYRVRATDAAGNIAWSDWVTVTVATSGSLSTYARTVIEDGPSTYWRMDEASGTTVADLVGTRTLTARAGVGAGAPGAIAGDTGTARTFSGTNTGFASYPTNASASTEFSVEAWFRANPGTGGRILGYGSSSTSTSGTSDRHIYLDDAGRLTFGVAANGRNVVTSSRSYNDGAWHHVVATFSQADGMTLYADGRRVAMRDDVRIADAYNGTWRVGGDNLNGWPNRPSGDYVSGALDEVAVYDGRVLTLAQVQAHYEAAGGDVPEVTVPADAYGAAVLESDPLLYWRFSEDSGSEVADAGRYGQDGTVQGAAERGVDGALEGVADPGLAFTGQGLVSSPQAQPNPMRFSTEAWFRTTTNEGGRIVGFGNRQSDTSSSYDRHTYMQNDGRLVFGVYRGAEFRVTTAQPYNDGEWHHVVSTLGDQGMRLYVDGELVGTNAQTQAENFTGYWRVGSDNTWGSSSRTLVGAVDEVAVYTRQLDAATVALHHSLGASGEEPNAEPTAAFDVETSALAVALDGSASADSDGSIESYAWDLGDGTAGTGETFAHTYEEAGTYTVTLTVTDDRGATGSATQQVTVVAPPENVAPTAAFEVETSGLEVSLDGSGSSDSDGSITSYAWDLGDGSTGTGETFSHTYDEAGTYSVTLTVTDDEGATGAVTQDVEVSVPEPTDALAVDAFGRSVSSGWGSADVGGAWSTVGPVGNYEVAGGEGRMLVGPGGTRRVALDGVSSTSTEVQTVVTMDPRGSGTAFLTVAGRTVGSSGYVGRLRIGTDDSVQLHVGRGVSAITALAGGVVQGLTFEPGTAYRVRVQVTGTSPTTVRAKVWEDGTAEPSEWRATATDSTAGLQEAGGLALQAYVGGAAGSPVVTVGWDGLWAGAPDTFGGVTPPENVAPTAAFEVETSGLEVSLDGSGSSDSDGSIASYEWDLGDGSSDSGASVSHTYDEAGTYAVTLTVTDDEGATDTVTEDVEVAETPENVAPTAAFEVETSGLEVSLDGSGSSDSDGSIASFEWDLGDGTTGTGETFEHTYDEAGTYEVTLTVTDDEGASGSVSQDIEVSVPEPTDDLAVDAFGRSVSSGWGSADVGGAWSTVGPVGNYEVAGGTGRMLVGPGGTRRVVLDGVSSTSTEVQTVVTVDPRGAGTAFLTVAGRTVGSSGYVGRLRVGTDDSLQLHVGRGVSSITALAGGVVQGLTFEPGTAYRVRVQVTGTSPTTVRAKVWEDGTAEPEQWGATATDATAELQEAGGLALQAYVGGAAGSPVVTVGWDDLWAGAPE